MGKKKKKQNEFKKEWEKLSFKLFLVAFILLIIYIFIVFKLLKDQLWLFLTIYFLWIIAFFYYEILNGKKDRNIFSQFFSWYIFLLNIISRILN